MATTKPRITITLSENTHRLLRSISECSNQPMSTFVNEMLESAAPTLERMAATFQAIKTAQTAERGKFLASLDRAQAALEPSVMNVVGQFDLFLANIEAAVSDGCTDEVGAPAETANPRPVTRGSTPLKRKKSAASTPATKASTRAASGRKS